MYRFVLAFLCLPSFLIAQQQAIYWQNPSFEGEPQDATVPVGWLPCELGTTPDILPGFWGVYQEASDGDTYVGLITRPDGTWESITQRLSTTIAENDCYSFSVDLSRGSTYSGYSSPLKLRIWGSTNKCEKNQLLYSSETIEHTFWKTYSIEFSAKQPIRYIIFEAWFPGTNHAYQGNVLLDNLTFLKRCPRV